MKNIKAIRSLLCEDHALNLPPNVLSITWMLGKRCNYDCSYCGPHFHDSVSPFIDSDLATDFIQRMHDFAVANNKKIKWNFSGGEPFVDPSLMPMLELLHSHSTTEQLDVTTNGSLPFETYKHSYKYLKGITVSLHLERSDKEIANTIDKLKKLKQANLGHVTVNLMFLPGRQQQVQTILDELTAHSIPAIVRKITPLAIENDHIPFVDPSQTKKSQQLVDADDQQRKKQSWYFYLDKQRSQRIAEYYTPEEEQYLSTINQRPIWQNAGVWHDGTYTELHTDTMIASDQNNFRGWTCFAGVDNFYIDFDGSVYRGQCLSGGRIGHIQESVGFMPEPTVCEKQWCLCNTEIAIRKVKSVDDINIVNPVLDRRT